MSDKQLRIGLIGTGFMGRAHSNAYRKAPNFFDLGMEPVLQAVCARSDGAAAAFAKKWGFASSETDWKALIARDDIDALGLSDRAQARAFAVAPDLAAVALYPHAAE